MSRDWKGVLSLKGESKVTRRGEKDKPRSSPDEHRTELDDPSANFFAHPSVFVLQYPPTCFRNALRVPMI